VPDSELSIVQQETFGPVQTVQVFDTEEEAVALANDTDYGLSACVWSRDADRPMRVVRQLDAGLISINSWANLTIEFEEGGFKSSGVGRLGGVASIEDFLEYKQITQNYASLGGQPVTKNPGSETGRYSCAARTTQDRLTRWPPNRGSPAPLECPGNGRSPEPGLPPGPRS
jgi:hypothetical protein